MNAPTLDKLQQITGFTPMNALMYAIVLGGMWMSMRDVVDQKAEKSDVVRIGQDVRAIRSMLCKRPENVGDSWCVTPP